MDGQEIDGDQSGIVVYDDDHFYIASAITEHLCRAGHRVTYTTPLPEIATWAGHTLEQNRIIERLNSLGVVLRPNFRITDGPGFECTLTGRTDVLDATTLVIVGARQPQDGLHRELLGTGNIGQLFMAGDCVVPGKIQAAVYSGHRTARQILGKSGPAMAPRRDQVKIG